MKILLLSLFIFGCSENYAVYSECENTDRALMEWQTIKEYNYYYVNSDVFADLIIFKWNNKVTPLGAYYGNGVIQANDNYRTILHELGHYFNYAHSKNSNSAMYKEHNNNATNLIDLQEK